MHVAPKSLQSCPTLCDPIDGSPPGSPVPGILQARTLEWVAISFSNARKWKVKSLSRVQLFQTPRTVAYQAPHPWNFPGKSTGVGCHCLLRANQLYFSKILKIKKIKFYNSVSQPHFKSQIAKAGARVCTPMHKTSQEQPFGWASIYSFLPDGLKGTSQKRLAAWSKWLWNPLMSQMHLIQGWLLDHFWFISLVWS